MDAGLLLAAAAAGLAVAAGLLWPMPAPLYALQRVGFAAAWAAALAALLLIVRVAVDRLRGRRRPPTPAAARASLLITGVGLATGLGVGLADGWAVGHGVGLALAVGLALLGGLTPRLSGRQRLAALAACVTTVQGLREAAVVDLHLGPAQVVRVQVTGAEGLTCKRTGWPEDRGLAQLKPGYTVVAGTLSGALGERLVARFGQPTVASNDFLVGRLSGDADAGGLACHLPGARRLAWQGSLMLAVRYTSHWGERRLDCEGDLPLAVAVQVEAAGVHACAHLKALAARAVGDAVTAHLRRLSGR
ncbi:MAG: hypothetical protein H6702_21035 [Myxococcales bacterium]|nr:hypothetical protein [Myxococcales bacterium]